MKRSLTIIIFTVIFFNISVSGQNLMSLYIDINEICKDKKITGIAVLAIKDGRIIVERYSGKRVLSNDGDDPKRIDSNSLFALASISKTFIGTVIMNMFENGEIKLGDDASKYLGFNLRNPYYPDIPINIISLLTHVSSINDSHSWFTDSINPDASKDYIKSYLNVAPGEKSSYNYSNLNFTLLAAIIENITGKELDEVIQDRIFNRLSINEGGFNSVRLDSSKFVLPYYHIYDKGVDTGKLGINEYIMKRYNILDSGRYVIGKSVNLVYPAAGMKISARNLARYMAMHMNGGKNQAGIPVISSNSEDLMRSTIIEEHNMGITFRKYRGLIDGRVLYGQTGGATGVKTCMAFDPELKIGFVVLTTGADSDYVDGYEDIHKPIIRAVYDYMKKLELMRP